MVAGKYNIRELFLNRYLDQIIIPEIQRDYVWTEEQVNGLFYSILKDFSDYKNSGAKIPEVSSEDGELKNAWKDFYQKRYYSSNIGFIYAYNDEQFSGKYFLIDGQQRITTIYLLLLALASLDKELAKEFKKIYTKNGKGKIDYKVRDSTQKFLQRFIDSSLRAEEKIEDQNWYFSSRYINDTSIQSILRNTKNITVLLKKENGLNYGDFYHYLGNFVQFWYFDTNISEQGEELYIYMNARGEQIQGNENLKADLLGRLNFTAKGRDLERLKNEYGTVWENWQDYFWTKRNKNENADKGFNEFLSCIAGLKNNMLSPNPKFYSKTKFEEGHKIKTKDLIATLNLQDVQDYIEALQFLDQNKEEFKALYGYAGWVDKCITEIWKLFNDNSTNWFADYNDANRATERNRMVFLWSILYYTKNLIDQKEELEESLIFSNIFRFMRMFYLRYKNNNRSVSTLKKTVDLILINGIWDDSDNMVGEYIPDSESSENEESTDFKSRTREEILRAKFLLNYVEDPASLSEMESAIWRIEDHKFNIDGSDVGATNFSHLLDLDPEADLETLQKIGDKLYELFPEHRKSFKKNQSVLLYYGAYWRRVSPWYYRNYKFDDWKRIIRNICIDAETGQEPFKNFFYEFYEYNGTLDSFLVSKRIVKSSRGNVKNFRERLLWYNEQLGEQMWENGNHIVLSKGEYCSLPNWKSRDKNFPEEYIIYSIDKNLKGGEKRELGLYIGSKPLPTN